MYLVSVWKWRTVYFLWTSIMCSWLQAGNVILGAKTNKLIYPHFSAMQCNAKNLFRCSKRARFLSCQYLLGSISYSPVLFPSVRRLSIIVRKAALEPNVDRNQICRDTREVRPAVDPVNRESMLLNDICLWMKCQLMLLNSLSPWRGRNHWLKKWWWISRCRAMFRVEVVAK